MKHEEPTSSDKDEAKNLTLPCVSGEERGRAAKKVSFPDKGGKGSKTKPGKKRAGPSRGKSPQLLKKEALQQQRERAIMDKIQEMELRHRREEILKERRSRQTPWLLVVTGPPWMCGSV